MRRNRAGERKRQTLAAAFTRLVAQGRIGVERSPERGDEAANSCFPPEKAIGEAALEQVEHDRDGRRGAGRRAQQRRHRSIGARHDFGSELEDAVTAPVRLDDLHA